MAVWIQKWPSGEQVEYDATNSIRVDGIVTVVQTEWICTKQIIDRVEIPESVGKTLTTIDTERGR